MITTITKSNSLKIKLPPKKSSCSPLGRTAHVGNHCTKLFRKSDPTYENNFSLNDLAMLSKYSSFSNFYYWRKSSKTKKRSIKHRLMIDVIASQTYLAYLPLFRKKVAQDLLKSLLFKES